VNNKSSQSEIQCSSFEALLADALDGLLREDQQQSFHLHAEGCEACGAMLQEAREGMAWLQGIEEIEPPKNLVHNILAATSRATGTEQQATPSAARPGLLSRMWVSLRPVLTGAVQPRFVTSFAMAFFSLSLTMSLAGVKVKDLAHMDLRPNSVRKAVVLQYTQVQSRVVRYYENMRLVYEFESRVRELRKAADTTPSVSKPIEQPNDGQDKGKTKKENNDTSGRPEQRQDYYSRELDGGAIAYFKSQGTILGSNQGA